MTPLVPDGEDEYAARLYPVYDKVGEALNQQPPRSPTQWGPDLRVPGKEGKGMIELREEFQPQTEHLLLITSRSGTNVRLCRACESDRRHLFSSARISSRASAAGTVSISPARYCW